MPRKRHFCHPGGVTPRFARRAKPRPKDAGQFVTRRVMPLCARKGASRAKGAEHFSYSPMCRCSCATETVAPRAYFFLSCQKKVCKKEAQDAEIALTREKACRSVVRFFVPLSVVRTPFGRRPHKLHIPRFRASAKARPFRCSSFPKHKRFAGLCFGSLVLSCSRPLNI